MVSSHKHTELETTSSKKRTVNYHDDDNDDEDKDIDHETIHKSLKAKPSKFQEVAHLQTPLPLEWQRFLDDKSGKTNFFNTKTKESRSRDPMTYLEAPPSRRDSSSRMSLDLDLHLPCGSHAKDEFTDKNKNNNEVGGLIKMGSPSLSSSCFTFEGDDQKELVTAVCHRCHMLIMMSKASLSCPNCKFIHTPQDNKFHGLSL